MLELRALEAGYGSSTVLFGLDLDVRRGEVLALLGRNGMGKTTTIRAISGLLVPSGGRIRFGGVEIAGLPAHRVARLGLGLVPEGRQVFPNLTVRENLVATAANRFDRAAPWTLERVYGLFPRLAERTQHLGIQLSGGEQQMLAIGRALMTNPHLLLLDEATEGLAPLLRREIRRCIAALKAEGQAILVVDKAEPELMALADRCVVLEKGRIAWSGAPAALSADGELRHRLLGV